MITVDPVAEPEFSASAIQQGDAVLVTLVGSADLNVKKELERFLGSVHGEALRISAREVLVDFRKLQFMNSSCLKCMVSWITRIRDLDTAAQYHLTFVSSENLYWQKRSLHALCWLASDVVSVLT